MRNSVIPDGTELLNVFLTRAGIVYLNLNRHIQDRHIGGLSAELATITSLVNTLLFNFKEINQVQILVEGTEIETLAGHVDCRKPFSKMLLIDS
jgi:spore germination protein GerM